MDNNELLFVTGFDVFKCTGSDCDDPCCYGWNIHITEEEYEMYNNVDHELKDEIISCISDIDENGRRLILFQENGYCKLLNKKGLCKIQKYIGYDYLSDVCKIYPRMLNFLNGYKVLYNSLSCNEVVKITILNKKKVKIENRKTLFESKLNNSNSKDAIYEQILESFLKILQKDNVDVWKKLTFILMMAEKIDKIGLDKLTIETIKEFENTYYNGLEFGDVFSKMEEIDYKHLPERIFFFNLVWNILASTLFFKTYEATKVKSFSYVIENIRNYYNNENYLDEVIVTLDEFVVPYLKENEYILENLLSHLFITQLYYGLDEKNISIKGRVIAILLINLSLQIFMAAVYKEMGKFDDHSLRNIISIFYRRTTHDELYIQSLFKESHSLGGESVSKIILPFMNS